MKKLIVNIAFYTLVLMNFCSTVLAGAPTGAAITLGPSVEATLIEITQIMLIVGAGVCIGKVIHIGILYVTSSAAEKSNAKMAVLPWLIGTFVCFGAATIGKFVINLLKVPGNVLEY